MDIADAFQLVLELAKQNQLTEREARDDPSMLGPELNKQKEAIDMVEDFATNQLGDD